MGSSSDETCASAKASLARTASSPMTPACLRNVLGGDCQVGDVTLQMSDEDFDGILGVND